MELVDAFKVAMVTALTKFHHVNHVYPANIIIYRDGVGDSQLEATQKHEVRSCCMLTSTTLFCNTPRVTDFMRKESKGILFPRGVQHEKLLRSRFPS